MLSVAVFVLGLFSSVLGELDPFGETVSRIEARIGPILEQRGQMIEAAPVECSGDADFDEMSALAASRVEEAVSRLSENDLLSDWVNLSEVDRSLSNAFGPLWLTAMETDSPECAELGLQSVFAPSLMAVRTMAATRLGVLMDEPDFFTHLENRDLRRSFFYTVQHADHDRAFQLRVLAELILLGESHPMTAAHKQSLIDRLIAARHGRQRYGTIYTCEDGEGRLAYPLEDEAAADEARRQQGLAPLEAMLEATCAAMTSGTEVVVEGEP